MTEPGALSRAQGCLLGQLAGDALGSLVEFRGPESIRRDYPNGVRDLADGGTFNTLAGQPTDDSEMALGLARSLVRLGRYDAEDARRAYVAWLDSGPVDCGNTIRGGLRGSPNPESQANGALMRVSPLGIFGARHALPDVEAWAREDAGLTHPHRVCLEVNALFATALADAIATGRSPVEVHAGIAARAEAMNAAAAVRDVIAASEKEPPADLASRHMGWVLLAFHNALWQLLRAPDLEEALVETVGRGGDTDTNAAICGALLGAVHGREAVPERWTRRVLACRPERGREGVFNPRPREYWPTDALKLARALL